jgi:CDP-glucose 4,6-dehydratase
MKNELHGIYSGKTVVVTGHTGFKGSWLTLWLSKLGAKVIGISLAPDQGADSVFDRADLNELCQSHLIDIRDYANTQRVISEANPEIIFHLAAQPLVLRSYRDPLETFSTNVMGTANVLEAARHTPSVRAVVCVTTDKVYNNEEWCWPYRETDGLGGKDPYSASKAAAELVARSYSTALRGEGGPRMATARGGNVVGGGDWSENRIVPDIIRALRENSPLTLRNPNAVRPWQHVCELCHAYLLLGTRLLDGWKERDMDGEAFVGSYNFGPDAALEMSVGELVKGVLDVWNAPDYPVHLGQAYVHESNYLRLDSSKARAELGWTPGLGFNETISWTADWYKNYIDNPSGARNLMLQQIEMFAGLFQKQDNK